MFLFGKKINTFLGIDIGASSIKLVELEKKEGRYNLKNYAIFYIGDYIRQSDKKSFLDVSKIPKEEFTVIIKELIQKAKIKTREVYLSIPVYSSFSTLMDLPIMSQKELVSAIPYEARKYVPVPISEVVLDWSIISPFASQADSQSRLQVLLVAAPKELISDYNQIIKSAGLKLKAIEEEAFSLNRALVGNDKTPIVLVDAGARSINVSIVDGGYLRLVHNLEMGLERIVKIITKRMNLNSEQIENMRKSLIGEKLSPEIAEIVNPLFDNVIITVKKIINSYQEKYNRRIEKCILTGGEIYLAGLVDSFTNKLGLEVSVGDPFARITYPSLLKSFVKELGPSLAVAAGLAMR